MIPVAGIAAMYSLAGHGLSENAEKRHWEGTLKRLTGPKSVRTGKLEKANPLPIGRYWIDVIGFDKISLFDQWLQLRGTEVQVENREKHPALLGGVELTPPIVFPIPSNLEYQPPRDWILFTNNVPVTWLAIEFGWPTIAGKDIHTSDDTVKKPDPGDILTEPFSNLPTGVKIVVGGVAILGVAVLAGYAIRSVR